MFNRLYLSPGKVGPNAASNYYSNLGSVHQVPITAGWTEAVYRTLLHMVSTGNRTPDLLILSPLHHMLPLLSFLYYEDNDNATSTEFSMNKYHNSMRSSLIIFPFISLLADCLNVYAPSVVESAEALALLGWAPITVYGMMCSFHLVCYHQQR